MESFRGSLHGNVVDYLVWLLNGVQLTMGLLYNGEDVTTVFVKSHME